MAARASTFPADKEAEPEVFQPENVHANLDIDDDEVMDSNAEDSELSSNGRPNGIMQEMCYSIHERLKNEVKRGTTVNDRFILRHLRSNNWWIHPHQMAALAKRLRLKPRHVSYYKRI